MNRRIRRDSDTPKDQQRASFENQINGLSLQHLRLVVAVSEERSLVGAAKRLNVTQSAVTKSLKEAEAHLGVRLFDRTNRGVIPTTYGGILVAHARLVIAQLRRAMGEINDLYDGLGGHIVVGTLLAASANILPLAIAQLRRERPKLVIDVVEGTNDILIPALRIGDLDLIVGRLPELREQPELAYEVLLMDIGCIVVRQAHPLVGRHDLKLTDLIAWDWVLPRRETTLRRQIDRAFRDEGVDPPMYAVESVSILTTRGLLLNADYLSIWPWQVACSDVRAGLIAILPVILHATAGPIGITTRANARLSPSAGALGQVLRSVSREMEPCPILADIPSGKG